MKTLTAGSHKVTAAEVERLLRTLTAAEKTNLGIEVTLPVAYGDGELVTVIVEQMKGELVVHDASFSAMRLSAAGVSLTPHVVHRLAEVADRYKVKFKEGRVTSTVQSFDDLTIAIPLVTNAARSVADYAYELKRQVENDFRSMVVEKLREIVGDRAHEADEFKGASGRKYRLPFILNASRSGPQNFISTLANRSAVTAIFAALYDLKGAFPDVERDAIYDDDAHLRDEDRSLLKSADASVFGWVEAERRFKAYVHSPRH